MKVIDVLEKEAILLNLKSTDKRGVIEELAEAVAMISQISKDILVQILMDREKLGSTGIGKGIAIPHGKLKDINNAIVGFGRSKEGVKFEAIDRRPCHIFFLIITPESSASVHLNLLGQIARMLKNETFKEKLISAFDPEEIYNIIRDFEENF
ncbi:MAG: PTS sugar transporter subunit IIA [Desulfobacterales bacterium]|nr:PTS sugar transporter subunit IIA [Desulfobacterales bacterium]MBF0398147.1 PTS sugar transporter subunit IIA [Desulfobacterales bacterium]